jgi:type II secretory pathway pseudopilin PulG
MEACGRGYTFEKYKKVKGVALISVLVMGIMIALVIGGLYYILTRTMLTTERVRVYTSTREAAVGGVSYAVLQIKSGLFDAMDQLGCPTGWTSDGDYCCTSNLNYRLSGTTQNFTNKITICLRGYAPPPGEALTGVAYSRPQPGGRGYIYSIISDADGPQGSRSRVEAVWMR